MRRHAGREVVEHVVLRSSATLRANTPCCVATRRAALQHAVLRCNMPCCVATCRAALQHAVLRCNMPHTTRCYPHTSRHAQTRASEDAHVRTGARCTHGRTARTLTQPSPEPVRLLKLLSHTRPSGPPYWTYANRPNATFSTVTCRRQWRLALLRRWCVAMLRCGTALIAWVA